MTDPRFDPLPDDPKRYLHRLAEDLAWGVVNQEWRNRFYLQGIPAWGEEEFSWEWNPDLHEYLEKVWNKQPPNAYLLVEHGYAVEIPNSGVGDDTALYMLTDKALDLVR